MGDDNQLVHILNLAGTPLGEGDFDSLALAACGFFKCPVRRDDALEKGIAREPVRPVEARASDFANRKEAPDGGFAIHISIHASALVVGGGHDRNGGFRNIQTGPEAGLVDGRKAGLDEVCRFVCDVEVDTLGAAAFHFGIDGTGHNVARSEFLLWVLVLHETPSALIDQNASLAANGLRNQERFDRGMVKAGGMELDELHIRDHRTGAPRHRHAVAGRDIGVRGVEVDLPTTAGGEHGDIAAEGFHHAGGLVENIDSEAAVLAGVTEFPRGDEVHGHVVLHDLDRGVGGDLLEEAGFDFAAGGIASVEDAAFRVAAFAPEVGLGRAVAVFALVEMHSEAGEFGNALGALGDDGANDILVAKAGAGGERVADVEVEGILAAHHTGHTALGPRGV